MGIYSRVDINDNQPESTDSSPKNLDNLASTVSPSPWVKYFKEAMTHSPESGEHSLAMYNKFSILSNTLLFE